MRKDWKEIMTNKAEFIEALQSTLWVDERSNLDSISYEVNLETREEYIYVFFNGGTSKRILATANSNYANAKAILEAVYG